MPSYDIQAEIINRLPIKSVIQFRSVSKAWKSMIESSHFIAHYNGQRQHLLVKYHDSVDFEHKYVSLVDDDTFPQQKVSLTLPAPVKTLKYSRIIGDSHGLLCLYGDHREGRGDVSGTGRAVIWNPSIRKAVDVDVSNVGDWMYGTVLGFGVCPETRDPKIVKIAHLNRWGDVEGISCIPWQVEVFTLSIGEWRRVPYSNLPRKSIRFDDIDNNSVVIDGFLYWLVIDRIPMDDGFRNSDLIISFDMTSEEFREINLPHGLAHELSMSKLRESLVVLERGVEADGRVLYVWMMEGGVSKSFTKLFTVNVNMPHVSIIYVRGFRKTGEPIVEDHSGVARGLAVYEPYSKHITNLGIIRKYNSFFVSSYMETLLLLDQTDFTIYANGKRYISKPRAKSIRLLKHTSKV